MKHTLLAILCSILSAIAIYLVPQKYSTSFKVQFSGKTAPHAQLPKMFELRWLENLRSKESPAAFLSPLQCVLSKSPNPDTLECQLFTSRRTSTRNVEKTLIDLKAQLGWVKREKLKDQLDSLSQSVQQNQETLTQIDAELVSLVPQDKKLKKLFDSLMQSLEFSQKDLDNKQTQLTMIQEAIPLQAEDTKAQFLQKELELKDMMAGLRETYADTEKKLIEEGFAYERLKSLKAKRKEIDDLNQNIMRNMVTIGNLLDEYASSAKVPDPDEFQILNIMKISSTGVHVWHTLFWSPILGFFLFALGFLTSFSRLKESSTKKSTYLDIHQLEIRLKAPYLGTLDLGHKEDKAQNQHNSEA